MAFLVSFPFLFHLFFSFFFLLFFDFERSNLFNFLKRKEGREKERVGKGRGAIFLRS